jgi:hypothetical protein
MNLGQGQAYSQHANFCCLEISAEARDLLNMFSVSTWTQAEGNPVIHSGQNWHTWQLPLWFLGATHLTMGSESCKPSRLRFCNLEHWDRMPWRVDTFITEFDRSICCTRKELNTKEKRLCEVAYASTLRSTPTPLPSKWAAKHKQDSTYTFQALNTFLVIKKNAFS